LGIFFVAEIGINHNGDIDICKKLISLASTSGCDAVKFQKRNIDKVYSKEVLDSHRDSPWGTTQREQKEGLEFGIDEYKEIDAYCRSLNIEWFASAWDLDSLNFLSNFNLKYNKVASAMIIDKNFLKEVAKQKKYTFISTGMSKMEYIEDAVEIFNEVQCPFELMHTVSTYPMNDSDANLNAIKTLKNKFKCKVGYSGHETGIAISIAAVSIGATSLERHITLDRAMYGSDQAASLGPKGIIQLVKSVREISVAFGSGEKNILESEMPVAKKLREHILINN